MTCAGWELHFKGNPGHCELYESGQHLGDVPMHNNLCHLHVEFIRPPASSVHDLAPFSAFTTAQRTWDLWHACLRHLGGELAKALPSVVTGVDVDIPSSQTRCDSCIVTKHPHTPFPLSATSPASHFLELVHSDICGPFPTSTVHGKQYFILFLDDHTHVLNIQLLATRDQVFEAWKIIQARWENKFSQRVITLQMDNGGEYVSEEFERYLCKRGVELSHTHISRMVKLNEPFIP